MSPEFRAGERVVSVKLCCTECGGRAEGNASWTDGSGEICDACVASQEGVPAQPEALAVETMGQPFCACGRVLSECDGSRRLRIRNRKPVSP